VIIAFLAWKEPQDLYFPPIEENMCEVMRYASVWYTKETSRAQVNIILFVFYHMDLHMLVNQCPILSPSLYQKYTFVAKFKVDFHRIYLQARKDTMKTWNPLPYLVTEDDIVTLIQ